MITVLVLDDDPVVRSRALRYLARPEIQLASAANGRLGLEQAIRLKPDVVICDVDMPEMDGFELLTALRADPALHETLVMMLTAESSRDSMRLGMTLGADDYLTKPFTGEELVASFEALMLKRGRIKLIQDKDLRQQASYLQHVYEADLGGGPHVTAGQTPPPGASDDRIPGAAVLCCELRGFTDIAIRLTPDEIACLLTEYGDRTAAPCLVEGARHLGLTGGRLIAVFADTAASPIPDDPVSAWQRARRAAAAVTQVAVHFSKWCLETFPDHAVAGLGIDTALCEGEVFIPVDSHRLPKTMARAGTGDPHGRTIDAHSCANWKIRGADGQFRRLADTVTRAQALAPPLFSKHDVQAGHPNHLERQTTPTYPVVASGEIRSGRFGGHAFHLTAVENAHVATIAIKGALDVRLASMKSHNFANGQPPLYLTGYRLLRRIGSGGMSSVYVAIRESDDQLLVLKVLEPRGELIAEQMARFTREYNMLSRITHPHVIRIYGQGFSNDHAYIAMEYFENGDLRHRLRGAMAPAAATKIAIDVANALVTIHALGIVHRDIKPENLMLRADGSVVLADFGIAKSVAAFGAGQPLVTHKGVMVGSPSYVSPEQIAGADPTPASDLYSLGVLFFEMLTGERPYQSPNVLSLLAQHARAPIPLLPPAVAKYQGVLNQLMAKRPADRPAHAGLVATALAALRDGG